MVASPNDLTHNERARWEEMVTQLIEYGIDPEQRVELLADFIRIDRRIVSLTRKEGRTGIAGSRALNVATGERRRLHRALFVGGRKPKDESLPPMPQSEFDADAAWRRFFASPGTPSERAAQEAALIAEHGEASWRTLIHPHDADAGARLWDHVVARCPEMASRPEMWRSQTVQA